MSLLWKFAVTSLLINSSSFYSAAYASQTFGLQNQEIPYPAIENRFFRENKCDFVLQKYNHYAYEEVGRDSLVSVGNGQMLHRDAARAFIEMQQAAKRDGIVLRPISGFRSISEQNHLFYGVAKRRGQSLEQRSKVSAPPGHSQHHTGFAVDLNSLDPSFAKTKAFAWLQQNAPAYGFELSFPSNNAQGVTFEPWHWAWHGNEDARLALHDGCM